MNWQDVGKKIFDYAPLVGAALSSPVGAAAAITKVVSDVLGVNTPKEAVEVIDLNPEEAGKRIQEEFLRNIEFQKIVLEKQKEANRHTEQVYALQNAENQSARANSNNVILERRILLIIYGGIFFICLLGILLLPHEIKGDEIQIMQKILDGSFVGLNMFAGYVLGRVYTPNNQSQV